MEKIQKTGKQWFILACACIAFVLVAYVPLPENALTVKGVTLEAAGRVSLGILIFCLVLWITEAIPFHITGMLGMVLLAVFKTDRFVELVKIGFGNDIVCFFIGVLTLSACITKSGIGKRISMLILSKTGNNTKSIIFGFLLVGALISMWMTDMAVAAMLLPLAKAILEEEGLKPLESNFGRGLMIACVWGPLIGGVGTPAGAGPNPLAIGFIKDMTGITVSFVDWMKFGVPSSLLMIFPAWIILTKMFKPELTHLSKTKADMIAEFKTLPPASRDEIATGIIFAITVFLWLSSGLWEKILGIAIPTSLPAIIGCLLFFFPGVTSIKWKFVEEDISWSGIILILSGISLGMTVSNTGAATWLSYVLLGGLAELTPLLQIFLIMVVISFLKVGFSSNTVTATIIVPLLIAMCQTYNLPILPILMPASITLSLAFILVTSSPTNVIPYSAGYFSIADFAKSGVVMTVAYSILLTFVIFGIGLLTGMY